MPAANVEALVIKSVREHLKLSALFDDQNLVNTHVVHVEVQARQLVIQFTPAQQSNRRRTGGEGTLLVPWQKILQSGAMKLPGHWSSKGQNARPIRSETRVMLVTSIAQGRRWLDEIISDPSAN